MATPDMAGINYWGWAGLYFLVPVVCFVLRLAYMVVKSDALTNPLKGETLLFGIVTVLAVLMLWPLLLIAGVKYEMDRRRDSFYCRPEHLLGTVTVQDAEAGAVVVDPFGRAPDLPFGHLHAAWQAFLNKKMVWWRLQKFHIPGAPNGQKAGYAWVGLGRIKAEFICEWD